MEKLIKPRSIDTAGEVTGLIAKYVGIVEVRRIVNSKSMHFTLKNVAYVPTMRKNLVSIPIMQQAGLSVEFPALKQAITVRHRGKIVMKGTIKAHNVAQLEKFEAITHDKACFVAKEAAKHAVNAGLLHHRFTHINCATIADMVRNSVVDGLEQSGSQSLSYEICAECKLGKTTAVPHKPSSSETREVGEILHADLIGKVYPPSLGGSQYVLTVVDDAYGGSWVRFLRKKTDTTAAFKGIMNLIKNRKGKLVQRVRIDRGTELFVEHLQEYFRDNGILHEATTPDSPGSNSKAEPLNRTFGDRTRAILAELADIQGGNPDRY